MDKVLMIGSGGREHALGWLIGQSDQVSEVLYAPGNAGTQEQKGRNLSLDGAKESNFSALADVIEEEQVGLTVVGPEGPLAEGLVDFLHTRRITNVIGPTQAAAALEADKFFSYDLMELLGIPQARSISCYTENAARRAIQSREKFTEEGIVLKTRGLAAGKGVLVCDSRKEALRELGAHVQQYGSELLVAERLHGQEFSVFGISDGNRVLPLELSLQDHKPLLDGDHGPNTGGMGAYGPAPIAPTETVKYVADEIMTPLVKGMKKDGKQFKGFLYAGMMVTESGPKVIEFNIRFGDPEAQPAVMLVQNGFYEALKQSVEGGLDQADISFNQGAACCVVLASQGYPGEYQKGLPISGLEAVARMEGVKVFHAGTKKVDGRTVTSGGRVLGVTAYSLEGIAQAQALAYEAASWISVPGGFHYRTDIADKAVRD